MLLTETKLSKQIQVQEFNETATAVNVELLCIDMANCQEVAMQFSGTWVGVVQFQASNDSDFSNPIFVTATVASSGTTLQSATASGIYSYRRTARYFRARVSSYTSGTIVCKTAAYWQQTQNTNDTITTANSASTNLIGDTGQQYRANAAGAASTHHVVSAASTNAAIVKASAGRLIGCSLANTTASWQYVKIHNTAGTPTAGASVAMTIGIPPNGNRDITYEGGIAFTTGIARTIVTGAADSDATATTANAVVGDLFFA